MYLRVVLLTMLVLPVGCTAWEHWVLPDVALPALMLKWFVGWSVGARLFLAGVRQYLQPRFTAHEIFGITDEEALPLVRELGVANFAAGVVAVASINFADLRLAMAIWGAIFYGIAGVRHIMARHRSANENIAMVSDLFTAVVLIGTLVCLFVVK